ncbi:hypothetical protein PY093_03110 [Cytobacillus sp. S13-E01]|uniref:carboxylate--amine ligase n=1 Tax=Cytobacillus sp. S13-E01 TaxID=3031326 RepID=UPI0023D7BFE8|nr:hypothetical protein [Cytobacillus sp. S13-E01]MDF0725701.1 hypothetical protein [Cytobacillus sp. S13-E01]
MVKEIFIPGKELWSAVSKLPTNRPPAILFNSHITGLAVARSLGREGVPIIALDRDGRAYGLQSKYVHIAAHCPNPLTDELSFIELLEEIGKHLPQKGVLFPSNDEWVFAVSRHRERLSEYYHFPFSELEIIDQILNKKHLYKKAEELNIPIPKTWYPEEWESKEELTEALPYPCIVKPVEQRSFYDAFGVKVFEIENKEKLLTTLSKVAGHGVVIQEIIGESLSDFFSLCSYVGINGSVKGAFVGQKIEQYPISFGTGCLVISKYIESIVKDGSEILEILSYQGISESEFIFDSRDHTYKLLDINTRTWKWIDLPIKAGINLPLMAYSEAIGEDVETKTTQRDDVKWVYFKDYLKLKQEKKAGSTFGHLTDVELEKIVTGQLPNEFLLDAVIDKDDPEPAVQLIKNSYNNGYVCPC